MSRIGKKPISIPPGVQVDWRDGTLSVRGPKGELKRRVGCDVLVKTENDQLLISVENGGGKASKAIHGLQRALIANMVIGVSRGFERVLEIVGIGYRAELSGRKMTLHLGYSHPIHFDLPEGIDAKVDRTKVTLTGIDKELLGKMAAKIRGFRSPEPYKGKGIKYAEEIIKRKAGKTGAK